MALALLPLSPAHAEVAVKRLTAQVGIPADLRAVAANDEVVALAGREISILPKGATDLAALIKVEGSSARLFTDLISHQGRFFALGVAESLTTLTQTPPSNLINPDSITAIGSTPQSLGITRLVLVEFSATGQLIKESIFDADRPLLPRTLRIVGEEIGIVGSIASEKGVQGFFARADLVGNWLSFIRYGDAQTEVRSLANLRTLYGTSSERLAGSDRRGVSDGVIFSLNGDGQLVRVVRSYLASSERAWDQVSPAHLAIGPVKRGSSEEVAITKFSAKGDPQWFTRYPGSEPKLDLRTIGFITSKKLSGIARISPKGKNAVFIEYASKGLNKQGTITAVRSIPARNLIDLADGHAIIAGRDGRFQLVPLAP